MLLKKSIGWSFRSWLRVEINFMRVLIVEDEQLARDNLEKTLLSIDPKIKVLDRLDQVKSTVAWLKNHQADLIFLDIHLADANSFRIFDEIEVETPIIFTTAYDQYAIQAFKVNSIDYLLKPIVEEELRRALDKYHATRASIPDWSKISRHILNQEASSFQRRFLVKKRGEAGKCQSR